MKIFNGLAAEGAFVEELQREVDRVKSSEEWRREYMTLQVLLDDTKKDAYSEGLAKGQADTLVRMVCKKLQKGKCLSEIAEELETAEDEIHRIVEIAKRYEPEYDIEAICKELTNS